MKEKWTIQDVNRMKELYFAGTPIKIIAKALKRTPTSVNKALARFQVRTSRHTTSELAKPIKVAVPVQTPPLQSQWVSIKFMENWLISREYPLHKCSCCRYPTRHYVLGTEHMELGQLLIVFNKIRHSMGLDTLWVEEVSC